MNNWSKLAKYVKKVYGTQVDREEGFFVCPECGDPVYSCDWSDPEFLSPGNRLWCPICEVELVD